MSFLDDVPIIPRLVLFGNPDKASPRLSPDGTRLAYIAPIDGVMNVWVSAANDPSEANPITSDKMRGIRIFFWAHTNSHIIYLQDKDGDENWHVYSVDLCAGTTTDLTPFDGVQAQIQEVSHRVPEEIVVGLNDRDPEYHDLHRVNVSTGERHQILQNDDFAGFILDEDYNVRFAYRLTPDGGSETFHSTSDGGWASFMHLGPEDYLTTQIHGFDESGRVVYMADSRDRDTAGLVAVDIGTGETTIIAEDGRADMSDFMLHPMRNTVEAVAFTYDRKRWTALEEDVDEDFKFLAAVQDGEMEIVSRSLENSSWVVGYSMDDGPTRYYHYDRASKNPTFLFVDRPELDDQPLVKMHSVNIVSRDGLELVSYYVLPPGSDSESEGIPDEPHPMLLFAHGGPWGRDEWGYDPVHQLFANRGYVVLSVNFRGSTGFGKKFADAGRMEWGGKMQEDLIDAVDWAIDEGIADPARIAIMGASYGGYAALMAMTSTPDTFVCGVDIMGPSNLLTFMESIPPYWQPQVDLFAARIGDHRTDEGRRFLTDRSPMTYADKIKKPLLIAQGANDPRVKQSESDQIVNVMREKGIPVTYALFPDEGHMFARPVNYLGLAIVAEAFLAKHLGGRYEDIPPGLYGSSMTVPVGAELVPGLQEALTTTPPAG